jgi:GT2 family glycosyltransferase
MINDEITILIVAYNSDDIILKNLSNLENFNVVIIDNFKNSTLKDKIINFSNINYVKMNNNLGEASGADIGLKLITTKYTLYLNPDTLIDKINILKLKEIFLNYPNIGILAPLHLNNNNEYIGNYFIHPFNQRVKRNDFEKKVFKSLNNIKPIGDFFPRCVWGTPIFFNTDSIKKIGFFDTDFFLYIALLEINLKLLLHRTLFVII